ncbi:MAG: prepilin-type N-terminal cleavage/methylation domain-containing protein [Proteobacteria bacterium]|nr:prepilin-type N-terminal cleavage/methylation domain-containing protein [Pseudomonadota bacterium]
MQPDRGLTLIELLIAMIILALLSALVLPLYNRYSDRAFRTEAQADLLNCAQGLERWASVSFSYLGAADTNADGVGDANAGAIAERVVHATLGTTNICIPGSVRDGRYNITVAATASQFTLTATPVGQMAGDGFMTFDDAANQAWDKDADGSISATENTWTE